MKRAMRENYTHRGMIKMASSPDISGQAMWQLKNKL